MKYGNKYILEQEIDEGEEISEYQILLEEAKEHLKNILGFFEAEYGPDHPLTAEWDVSFALVMLKTGNTPLSKEFLEKAYFIYMNSLGEYDPKTKQVGEIMKKVEEIQRNENEEFLDDEEDQ